MQKSVGFIEDQMAQMCFVISITEQYRTEHLHM